MKFLREWLRRLSASLRPRRSDAELEEELRLHLELAAEAARRRGLTDEEARHEARQHAGGVAQAMDALREQRGVPLLSGAGHDLRMALRSLRATPLVTVVTVVSLALAIGANTAIFSIVNSLLLRDLPIRDADRLVHVTDSVRRESGEIRVRAWSNPAWEQLKQRPGLFAGTAAWSFVRFDLAQGGETQFVEGMWADGGFFRTLGVSAALGRVFSETDDRRGGGPDGPVAVISHRYWERQYSGRADAIGRPIQLNGVAFTIVGVLPRGFFGLEVGRTFDVIVPLATESAILGGDSVLESAFTNFLSIVARLKPGQSIEAAAADLRGVQAAIREATLDPREKDLEGRYLTSPFHLLPASTGYSYLRGTFRKPLLILAAVVALVLLIGCLNVANLLLARAIARRHELSVQLALGASRWRLARQMLAESAVLSGLGAALGMFIAGAGARFLVRQLSTPAADVALDLALDRRVLAFTMAATAATTLLFGIAPAFRAARAKPIEALNERARTPARDRRNVMTWLVAAQVALSTVLLVSAGLFVRSFASLANRDLGFRPDPVLVATIDPERANVNPEQRVALYERVRSSVLGIPNVGAAAISLLTPVGGGGMTPPVELAQGETSLRLGTDEDVFGNLISPGWFDTFGTPIVAGRDFTDRDRQGGPGVAIVNQSFARRFIPDGSALGRTITLFPGTPRALRLYIVGISADAVYSSPRETVPATWYMPLAQFDVPGFPFTPTRLSVRADGVSPAVLTKSVAAAAVAVNPRLALTFRPAADHVRGALRVDRLMAQLASFFGGVAILLAALGVYGVTAYAISGRRREIGIRLALGAAPRRIVAVVFTSVMLTIGAGIACGVGISLWASKFAEGLLYDLPPRDPATMIGAACLLLAIGVAAGGLPALRAAWIDPGSVLREG